MALHQLLLFEGDGLSDAARVELLRAARDTLRVVHEERARGRARPAVLGAVSRARRAAL